MIKLKKNQHNFPYDPLKMEGLHFCKFFPEIMITFFP